MILEMYLKGNPVFTSSTLFYCYWHFDVSFVFKNKKPFIYLSMLIRCLICIVQAFLRLGLHKFIRQCLELIKKSNISNSYYYLVLHTAVAVSCLVWLPLISSITKTSSSLTSSFYLSQFSFIKP